MKENQKVYALLFVPIFLGLLINSPLLWFRLPLPFSALFLIFWFWVGMKFANLSTNKVYALLLGNSLNIFSLAFFIWSFSMFPLRAGIFLSQVFLNSL